MICLKCCLNHHKAHDFSDVIEDEDAISFPIYETQKALEQLCRVDKQTVTVLEKCKATETKFAAVTDIYSVDYINDMLQDICSGAIQLVQPELKFVKEFQKEQKRLLSSASSKWESLLNEIGKSQSAAREVLSSSPLTAAGLLSDKQVTSLIQKLGQEQKYGVFYLAAGSIENFHSNIVRNRKQLQNDIAQYLQEFLKHFKYEKITISKLNAHTIIDPFHETKIIGNSGNLLLASCTQYFSVAIPKAEGYQISKFCMTTCESSYSYHKSQPENQHFKFKFIPSFNEISYFCGGNLVYNFNQQYDSSQVLRAEKSLAYFDFRESYPMVIMSCQTTGSWKTTYQFVQFEQLSQSPPDTKFPPKCSYNTSLNVGTVHLCASKLYPEEPYSFSFASASGCQWGSPIIACISKNSLFLYAISNSQETDFGNCPVNCDKIETNTHKGKFGCGFFHEFGFSGYTKRRLLLGSWCVECQNLQVLRIETDITELPTNSLNDKSEVIIDLQFQFATGIESVASYKGGLLIVTKDWKLFTCHDITSAEMQALYYKI